MTLATRLRMAGRRPFYPRAVVTATTTLGSGGTADWWGRSYVVRRPSDNALVMVYRRATAHDSETSCALHIKFSTDDGATWTAENTKVGGGAVSGFPLNPASNTISFGEGMPLIAPNGDLIILMWRVAGTSGSFTPHGTHQARSTDGGNTWTVEGQITSWGGGLSNDLTFATDDWFTFDGTTYSGARVYNGSPITDSYVVLVKNTTSNLALASWAYVSDITTSAAAGTQEVGLTLTSATDMLAIVRALGNNATTKAVSTDLGATWSTSNATTTFGVSGRHRLYTVARLQGEANWWEDPRLLMGGFMLNVPGSSQTRTNSAWYSPDRGLRWFGPFTFDATVEDAGYGDIWGKADGTFGMVNYQGTLAAASLKQYDFTMAGI